MTARYEEEEEEQRAFENRRRTRRGGQNLRNAAAELNRQKNKDRYVLVGDADTFRRGLQQRQGPAPRQVGLQPSESSSACEKGTSFFTTGHSEKLEIPGQFEGFQKWKVSSDKQSECFQEWKESADREVDFSFHATHSDACENGLAFHTENSAPPTVCILDLGCTRAMGSRKAVEAFCRYVDSHKDCGL